MDRLQQCRWKANLDRMEVIQMKKPYPKQTEVHENFSKMTLPELEQMEVFLRNSANASYKYNAANAKLLHQKHDIVKYYIYKLKLT